MFLVLCVFGGFWEVTGFPLFVSDIPIISPLPLSSLAMLTLFPGEPSARSTSGILSPTWTKRAAEEWKPEAGAARRRRPVASGRAEDKRVANMTN